MKTKMIYLLLTLTLTGVLGCGTVDNVIFGTQPAGGDVKHSVSEPAMEVYGGVKYNWQYVESQFISPDDEQSLPEYMTRTAAAMALVDLPLSAIGDTLTLGYTIPASRKRREENNQD